MKMSQSGVRIEGARSKRDRVSYLRENSAQNISERETTRDER